MKLRECKSCYVIIFPFDYLGCGCPICEGKYTITSFPLGEISEVYTQNIKYVK